MDRIWTKSFTLLSAGTFFLFIAFYMLYPTMPLCITSIGGTEADAGLALGAVMLGAIGTHALRAEWAMLPIVIVLLLLSGLVAYSNRPAR